MNTQEQKLAQGKPYLQKLKDLGMGFTMDRVCGDRVLIAPIQPFTEMDKVEKSGLLYVPDSVKATNAPPPTTGLVVMMGADVTDFREGEAVMFSRYAGMDIMLDNKAFKLVHANEIACVLKCENPDAIELVEEFK